MDLTNIKPCVECANKAICRELCADSNIPRGFMRVNRIFVLGEDCFEEVDDG